MNPAPPEKPVVAWRVTCDEVVAITFAKTRGAAQYNMLNSAREAGYYLRGRAFPSVLRASRAPEYDKSHLRERCGRGTWDEAYVRTA